MIIFTKSATKANISSDYSIERKDFNDNPRSPWAIDEVNPNKIVGGFSTLKLKNEYRLIAYLYLSHMGGNGFVYAIPKDDNSLTLTECDIDYDTFLNPPRPNNALSSFMEAIDGDRTPFSYLQAAVLCHTIYEFGASGHGSSWSINTILPIENPNEYQIKYEWDMVNDEPEVVNPHFYYDENQNPVVVFFIIDDVGTIKLNEIKHTFSKDNYTMKISSRTIATAGSGIIY